MTDLYTALLAPIVFGLLASTPRAGGWGRLFRNGCLNSGVRARCSCGGDGRVRQCGCFDWVADRGNIAPYGGVQEWAFVDLISARSRGIFGWSGRTADGNRKFPEMLGLTSGSLWQHVVTVVRNLGLVNGMTLTVSVLVVGVILLSRKARFPGELIGLVLAGLLRCRFVGDYG